MSTAKALAQVMTAIAIASCVSAAAQESRASTKHSSAGADAPIHNVFWQPNDLHQGSPVYITVELDKPATKVKGTLSGKTVQFFHEQHTAKVWHALAGIDLEANPGQFGLDVAATLPNGHLAKKHAELEVATGEFQTGDVNVAENYVNPNETEQKQIAGDDLLKKRAYGHSSTRILWSGDFEKPVQAQATPSFGESRILNEEKTSLHTGTDYPTKEGSSVLSANSGVVVLTRHLFYEGDTVIIDHGQGLFTAYLHLSRTDVKENQVVKKGERIGLSGASGRVTGPHLHFAVRWQGEWLDPVQVLALTLPRTTAGLGSLGASAHPRH